MKFQPRINFDLSTCNDPLKNYAKFTRKHLWQSLFFNTKKEALAQVFSCEVCDISKNTFSYRTPPVAASEYKESPF